jgi:probable O-glycosylation ligase (exosortase A-associated)
VGFRDFILFAVVFAGIPFILRHPWIGVIYWVWLSLMNPHRLAWGLAYDFPFAQLIALVTFAGVFLTSDERKFKGGGASWFLAAYVGFACLTTLFALVPAQAGPMLERVLKIQILTFVALLVLHKREHVVALVWAIVLSIGYYAVKGGIFTIATLGAHRVWGPADSFIEENNALALATIMTIPLWVYLFVMYRDRWWRWVIALAILLSAVSALGSHSRGALVAIVAMSLYLWLKSHNKFVLGILIGAVGIGMVAFMPDNWAERMRTIAEYSEDASAMGRIETWHMMYDIAVDRPLVGGGFEPYAPEVLTRYRPEYQTVRSAHSIYFQVLGEHGFIGLAFFLAIWAATWRMGVSVIRATSGRVDDEWAYWVARMSQVSLVAYLVGGAFLNLANWDMPYYLMVILAVTRYAINNAPSTQADATSAVAAPPERVAHLS